jgi:hypothetical protein
MDQAQFSGKPRDVADQTAKDVPVNFQEAFSKVVQAGMKVMFSEETHDLMIEQLNAEGDLGQKAGESIAGLMLMLFKKSNETMPLEVIMPAGTYLLAEAGDFIEKVTKEELTPDILADAMQTMLETIATKFGVDPAKLLAASQQAQAAGVQ